MRFLQRTWQIFWLLAALLGGAAFNSARAQENLIPELVRRVKPSVVAVITFNARGAQLSQGSGFFIAPDRVITNRHVIEGAQTSEVRLTNEKSYRVRGVLAVDGAGDIALLQVDIPSGTIPPLTIAGVSPQEGETVVVIGNPLGLEGSVSNGIVSAVRIVPNFGRIIQITAPISQGSSGSPVINLQGQVIGVATLQITDGQSLNFAVPAERVAQLQAGTLQSLSDVDVTLKRSQRAIAERFYLQGLGFLSRDDCERAQPYFIRATETDATYAEAWEQSGFCFGVRGKPQDAVNALQQAARLRPESLETHLNLGAALMQLNQFKEAAAAYRAALRLDNYNADAQFALGLAYGKMNQPDEEAQAYRQVLKLKPDYAPALERLGQVYLRQEKFNEGVALLKQYLMLRPDDANAFDTLGSAYLKLKQNADGVEAFRQAVLLKPDFARAYYNLGVGYLALGDTQSALTQYNILKSLDADRAQRLYGLIYP